MLTCPRVGQRVVLHYNQRLARSGAVPHHGKVGTVAIRSTRGKPRNHLVRLDDGGLVVVPCGNLRPAPEPDAHGQQHGAVPVVMGNPVAGRQDPWVSGPRERFTGTGEFQRQVVDGGPKLRDPAASKNANSTTATTT